MRYLHYTLFTLLVAATIPFALFWIVFWLPFFPFVFAIMLLENPWTAWDETRSLYSEMVFGWVTAIKQRWRHS